MKRPLLIHFLLALLWIVPINELTAQIKCKIDNYSTEDGLSHDAVGYILKDKEGFMWFATWDGINRFDGKNFITYKATSGDNSSLGNNRISLIKEDASGYIWLRAYDNQIYRFDKSTESFLSIATILGTTKIEFVNIIPADNGNVWLTTVEKGIFLTQKKLDGQLKISHFKQGSKNHFALTSNKLNFVFEDKDKSLWLGSNKGLDHIPV